MTDTKTAVRQAAVGQDFGADTAAFDPDAPAAEEVAQDKRGILQTDFQSYERTIEGLKRAADGARHRAAVNHRGAAESWNALADKIDKGRQIAVRLSGFNRPEDGQPTKRLFGGKTLSLVEATTRISTGLREAAAGCRQISNCHRSVGNGSKEDVGFSWLRLAIALDRIGDDVKELERRLSMLWVTSQWVQ
jgi:hypothetical protein